MGLNFNRPFAGSRGRDALISRLGLAMAFIAHDLRAAAQVCDRVAATRRVVGSLDNFPGCARTPPLQETP